MFSAPNGYLNRHQVQKTCKIWCLRYDMSDGILDVLDAILQVLDGTLDVLDAI